MGKLLRSEVWIADVPAKLLLVTLAFQLEVEMDRDQCLFTLPSVLTSDVGSSRSQDKLLINCLIESGIARTAGVETVQPFSKRIFNLDVMPLHLPLQPQREGRMVDACFPRHVYLLDVVLAQSLQHLRADVLLVTLYHILCRQPRIALLHIHTITLNDGTLA